MSPSLTSKNEIKRFLRYFLIGFSTFIFDLLLIYILVDYFRVSEVMAAGYAFLVAVSLNYYLVRKHAFSETKEGVAKTYAFFICMATAGFFSIVALMFLLTEIMGLNYLLSRVLIGAVVGMIGYLINLFFNFKVHN